MGSNVAPIVGPRTARFYTTVAVLTPGPDREIADAVRNLVDAVGAWLEEKGMPALFTADRDTLWRTT
jgi:hypothetical protein